VSNRGLHALGRDLERWGRGLDVQRSEQDFLEFRAARAAALSLKIDMNRLTKRATSLPRVGAFARPNTGRGKVYTSNANAWQLKARGPVHWAEYGTSAHYVVARAADTSKRARRRRGRQASGRSRGRDAQVLSDGSRTFGQYAYVRGMRARPFWFAALRRYFPEAVDRAEPEVTDAMRGWIRRG